MRSTTDFVGKALPEKAQEKRSSGPVACAVFIAVLAIGVTGGTLWLTSAVIHNNAQAANLILGE
jgi:hypothetical protein